MATIVTDDGVTLYAEEAGQGEPLVFIHEFAGDHRSWEPQVRFFSAAYRCVSYAARGYPPSGVPTDPAAPPTLADLTGHLERQDMARHFWPEYVRLVTELPKTATGKIQKFRLRQDSREWDLGPARQTGSLTTTTGEA